MDPHTWLPTVRHRPFLLAISMLVAGSLPATPQESVDRPGVITGTVTGEDAGALAGAEVSVGSTTLRTVTDPAGRFRLPGVPAGAGVLEVRMIGYRAAAISFDLEAGGLLVLDAVMDVDPVPLDPLDVRARSRLSPQMRGFYERRGRAAGHFFTRQEIAAMQSRQLTDVLRRVPGVRIEPVSGPLGTTYAVRMQRASGMSGARACPVLYFVNGMPFPVAADMGINTYVRPDEIDGMEVYSGASRLPPQFHLSPNHARCGVVVIWTLTGDPPQTRP